MKLYSSVKNGVPEGSLSLTGQYSMHSKYASVNQRHPKPFGQQDFYGIHMLNTYSPFQKISKSRKLIHNIKCLFCLMCRFNNDALKLFIGFMSLRVKYNSDNSFATDTNNFNVMGLSNLLILAAEHIF